jgi:hypothetical protein
MEEPMTFDVGRLTRAVVAGRKDELLIDCARLVAVHYGKMIEHFSGLEKRPISAHNNKTLFLEGLDLWSRARFFADRNRGGRETENPREVVAAAMEPFYDALELDDPARWRPRGPRRPPAYVGDPADAQCAMLALCASLDITPVRLRFGIRDGSPERMWGRVQADGEWYDSDIADPSLALGERADFPEYREVEVPL